MRSPLSRRIAMLLLYGLLVVCAAVLLTFVTADDHESSTVVQNETTTTVYASWPKLDLPTSIAAADVIVVGEVVGDQWTSRGVDMSDWGWRRQRTLGYIDAEIEELIDSVGDYVYTHSRFRVDRCLRGECPQETVEVWCTGGEYGSHTCVASGFPQVRPNTQYVLFLARVFHGGYEPVEVYEIHGNQAVSVTVWRTDSMRLEELLAVIEQHKNDPLPWIPTSQQEAPSFPGAGNAASEEGIPGETTAPPNP